MEKSCEDKDAGYFKVVDAETGIMLRDVTWANDATGEYDQRRRDEGGELVIIDDRFACERKTGKIKFVDVREEAK